MKNTKTCKNCTGFFKNPHNLCILAEMDKVNENSEICQDYVQFYEEDEDNWQPGDAPWDAPGMSIKDFI